jgi:hypothetical protein
VTKEENFVLSKKWCNISFTSNNCRLYDMDIKRQSTWKVKIWVNLEWLKPTLSNHFGVSVTSIFCQWMVGAHIFEFIWERFVISDDLPRYRWHGVQKTKFHLCETSEFRNNHEMWGKGFARSTRSEYSSFFNKNKY